MIPDWKLERFLTGDLPEGEMHEIRKLEATDEMLAQRLKLLREDNKAILKKLPFEAVAGKIAAANTDFSNGAEATEKANVAESANVAKTMPSFSFVKFAAAAVLVLAVALVAFMTQRDTVVTGVNADGKGGDIAQTQNLQNMQVAMNETASDTRIKGLDARMEVWKKTTSGIVQLQNLDEVYEGDEIQLRYAVPEKCFGLLFSMDGNGALTLHMGDGVKAIELAPGKMNSLPFAYKLDDAPYFEKFFFVTSPKEFAVEENDVDKLLKRSDVKVIGFTLKKAGK